MISIELNALETYLRVSVRKTAWRNLIVSAINAGLEQGLFSLRPGDNPKPQHNGYKGVFFDFIVDGMPARGYVAHTNRHGAEELDVRAAINPPKLVFVKGDALTNGFLVKGDAYATGWLRKDSDCRLLPIYSFSCRNALKPILANLKVKPQGYVG